MESLLGETSRGASDESSHPPVVLVGFNRPGHLARVVESVASSKVSVIYFVSDGARTDRLGEAALVSESQRQLDRIGSQVEVHRIFSKTNLGCRNRIQTGLDEVFSAEDSAIILEDDCVPDATFFPFCRELLHRYRTTTEVGAVCGTNFGLPTASTDYSYSFSRYPFVWGWATWARVWEVYDRDARSWGVTETKRRIRDNVHNRAEFRFWSMAFASIHAGFDTWDYQLALTFFDRSFKSAVPSTNLVTNVGFGANATHTISSSPLDRLPTASLLFPLNHPASDEQNRSFDAEVARTQYQLSRSRAVTTRLGAR